MCTYISFIRITVIKTEYRIRSNFTKTQNQLFNTLSINFFVLDAVCIPPSQVMFVGRKSTNSEGFIAIDDITVREGACSNKST